MMMRARTRLNRHLGNFFRRFGFEIRRAGRGFHADAFEDQKILLEGPGRSVRTILDLGANTGQTARHYRSLFPEAEIHSFEPFEPTFRELARALGDDPKFHPVRLAVADVEGSRRFFANRESVTNSLLPIDPRATEAVVPTMIETVETLEVPATTLDAFCEARALESIQILKMDIQGGELLALRGAVRLLERRTIDLVYAEVLFAPHYEGQADFCEVRRFLADFGYDLYMLYNLSAGRNSLLAWADAIFLSPELRARLSRTGSEL